MRCSYLIQRGATFYFQCRIPADVKHFFPCTQIKKSLKTSNRKQAASLVKVLTAKTEKLFFMARSGLLTAKVIESLVQEYFVTLLDQDKRSRYDIAETPLDVAVLQERETFRERHLMSHRKNYQLLCGEAEEVEEVSGAENLASYYRTLICRYREQAQKQDHSEIAPVAAALLAIEKVHASPDSPEFKMFCDALLAKEIEANEVLAERAERGLSNQYDRSVSVAPSNRKKLSALITRYFEIHDDRWKQKNERKYKEHFGKILELTGNPYTDEISQDMLVNLLEDLQKYPKCRNHKHLKNLTLEQCQAHPKYAPLGTTSIDQLWFAFGSLLTYGSENGNYGIARNFCTDKIFTVKRKGLKKEKDDVLKRVPYDKTDIQNLVNQLGKVRKASNPHHLWIPLIALYSGMRQSEICQLFCDDIVVVDGIDCFRVRDCEQRQQSVKNPQSQRTIPIHPTLLKLGLLDFVASRRKLKYERPWENVSSRPIVYYPNSDNYSHYFEKWYNGTFRKYVIPDEEQAKLKPFHSLRHTFINWFFQNVRSQDRDNSAVKGLVGHLESEEQRMIAALLQGVTWEVYSQELNPVPMMETLKLLDYGVDLAPLRLPAQW